MARPLPSLMPKSSEPFSICSRAVICLRYSMVFLRLRGFAIFATVAAQKGPPFCDGPVSGETPRSHLQRRKLTTFRPGRLCLFTHSTPATAGQLNPRDHAVVDGIRFGDLGQGVSPPGVLAFQATAPTSNCSYPQAVL